MGIQGKNSVEKVREQDGVAPLPAPLWKACISALLLLHFCILFLMVATTEGGGYTAPPLLHRAAGPVLPWVRFLGMHSGYRFFAPDPGPATVLWGRLTMGDGTVRWVEHPSKERHGMVMGYQRDLYPAMMMGVQVAPASTVVAPGRPRLTDAGVTYACSYARHLAMAHGGDVAKVELYAVTHGIRTPRQVRSGWGAADARLYYPVRLGVFRVDGVPLEEVVKMGLQRPLMPDLLEQMIRDGGWKASPASPGEPEVISALMRASPELGVSVEGRPLKQRILEAVTGRDDPAGKDDP